MMSSNCRLTLAAVVASITSVVFVDLTPSGAGCAFTPPEFVSFIAVHAGAFGHGVENVSVQVLCAPSPMTTLPAASDPWAFAPIPQSAPRVGARAKVTPDQSNRVAAAKRKAIAPGTSLRMIPLL